MQIDPNGVLLNVRDVQRLTTLSRATIYRFVAAGKFPAPIKLSLHGRVAWRYTEVCAWSESPLNWDRHAADNESF